MEAPEKEEVVPPPGLRSCFPRTEASGLPSAPTLQPHLGLLGATVTPLNPKGLPWPCAHPFCPWPPPLASCQPPLQPRRSYHQDWAPPATLSCFRTHACLSHPGTGTCCFLGPETPPITWATSTLPSEFSSESLPPGSPPSYHLPFCINRLHVTSCLPGPFPTYVLPSVPTAQH